MERRFGSLHLIATLFRIAAIGVFVMSVLTAIGLAMLGLLGSALLTDTTPEVIAAMGSLTVTSIVGAAMLVVWGAVVAIPLYAFGEVISVFLAIEENTRRTATVLEMRASRPAPQAMQVPPAPVLRVEN